MNGWPVVFLFVFSVFAAAGEDVSRVTICSWNVQNFGVTDRFIDGKQQKAAMKPDSEIESMQVILGRINPDIFAASEILQAPDDTYLKLFRKKLEEAGLNFPYMATVKGGDVRIQTVLFSRFPIVSEEPLNTETFAATELDKKNKQTNKIQMRVGRGFINTVIQVTPDFRMRVMVAHLKSKRSYPELDATSPGETGEAFVRRNEALILKNAMNRILASNPDEPLIVLGDFNDTYRSRAVQTVLGSKDAAVRIFDLWLTDYFGDWWTHFYLPDKSYERIDYMFVSQPLFNRFVKEKSYLFRPNKSDAPKYNTYNASDHRPLVAVFNVR